MPGWDVHAKVYRILGLNPAICRVIDELVDREPPLVREVIPGVGLEERLPIHYGFGKTEFPYMYNYVVQRYGLEGAKCLLVHFVLDQVENSLKKGYTSEMVRDAVEALLGGYDSECGDSRDKCFNYDRVMGEVRAQLARYMDAIIAEVGDWLSGRTLPIDILVNASGEILSLMLRIKLYMRGYRGRRGFTVNHEAFVKTYPRAKTILRQKVFKAAVNNIIKDLGRVVESINRIKQELASKHGVTVGEYMDSIRKEQQLNPEFEAFIRMVEEAVVQAVKEYEQQRNV